MDPRAILYFEGQGPFRYIPGVITHYYRCILPESQRAGKVRLPAENTLLAFPKGGISLVELPVFISVFRKSMTFDRLIACLVDIVQYDLVEDMDKGSYLRITRVRYNREPQA